mmetsp:Transcript_13729/g.23545  ORF Transcript_13729/g.23545 Transcript_13729/m.23545 type:complete len:200 (+) Transcript_13729:324-923(+)
MLLFKAICLLAKVLAEFLVKLFGVSWLSIVLALAALAALAVALALAFSGWATATKVPELIHAVALVSEHVMLPSASKTTSTSTARRPLTIKAAIITTLIVHGVACVSGAAIKAVALALALALAIPTISTAVSTIPSTISFAAILALTTVFALPSFALVAIAIAIHIIIVVTTVIPRISPTLAPSFVFSFAVLAFALAPR